MTYQEAKTLHDTARGESKPLENNTRLYKRGTDYAIRLHDTDVVTIHPSHKYTLDSGGWLTMVTKDRINKYSPAYVEQLNKMWYVKGSLFYDNMKVDTFGTPLKPKSSAKMQTKQKKLDKKVRAYIKGYKEHLLKNGLTDPSNGDCWGCAFGLGVVETNNKDRFAKNEPMGLGHLISHFKEKYYVPSLLYKAIKERGYGDPAFIWRVIRSDLERGEVSHIVNTSLRAYFRKRNGALLKLI